jgi:hypothetical protein
LKSFESGKLREGENLEGTHGRTCFFEVINHKIGSSEISKAQYNFPDFGRSNKMEVNLKLISSKSKRVKHDRIKAIEQHENTKKKKCQRFTFPRNNKEKISKKY